ncbi:ATP-binding protein [Gemmatimonadota bacterium]
MINRLIRKTVLDRLQANPAVSLIGPRQCGKTTLARDMEGIYFDLEQDSERLRLDLDWDSLVAGHQLIILDEAQSWPSVFPRLRGAIDNDRRKMGRFLLLGSVSPTLMIQVSESLAGRLSLIELTPFLVTELEQKAARERRWLYGGYPDGGVLKPSMYPQWQLDYLALLSQRDLPAWGLSAKPQTIDRLLRMLAALHGQVWNASDVGRSLGLSYHTVNSYLDYLAGAFIIRRLPAYQANIKKRLVKSPRIYWRDSGLQHALMNVPDRAALLTQPWVGASWEGFVIEQVLGELAAHGQAFNAYHFRTSDQHEIDLVLDFGNERWAVEVKLSSAPAMQDMARLDAAADMIGATRRFLVSQTTRSSGNELRTSCNLETFLQHLQDRS